MSVFYTIGHISFWIFFKVFFFIKSEGIKNIPKKGSIILASNHVSFFDPPAIGTVITHRQIYFVARATLFRFPVIGTILKLVHACPIELKGNWEEGLKNTMDLLKKGNAVLIFPEGTRSPDGTLKQGRGGIGIVAYHSKVPVVPVLIKGSFESLPKHSKIIKPFNRIKVKFGAPINLDEFYNLPGKSSTYKKISDAIMLHISKLNLT